MSKLKQVLKGVIVIGFGILVGLLIFPQFQEADAQRSTRQMLQELERQGITNCEIWQINEFLYKPVRIALIHERVDAHEVKITSEDPASEVNWVGSKEDFRLVTDSAGQHTAQVILDYELKHEDPRQVFFQVFAKGNTLMMEGNWVHEGFNFCKIIDFTTTEAPTQLTAEEIQEENNKFNSEFRREVAEQNTTVENGLLIITIVVLVVGIAITIYFIIIIMSMTGMAKVSKRPAKKLDQMIEAVRKLADVLRLQTRYNMTTDKESKEKFAKLVDDKLRDLAIMTAGTMQKVELEASFPSPKSLAQKNESKSPPEQIETEDERKKQQKLNEDVYKEGYLQKQAEIKEEITFATLDDTKQKQEPQAEEQSEEETIEISIKNIKPCVYCSKPPDYFCKDCKKMFCKEHESHNCKNQEKKTLSKLDSIASIKDKIIKSVMEKPDSAVKSDDVMQKLFDTGKSKEEVKKMLVKEYMKIPYKEAREIYDKLQKDFEKKKTFPQSVRIVALLERLVRSDK